MKRRDFIAGAAGIIGSIVPLATRANTKPCPPPLLQLGGGGAIQSGCRDPGVLDWVPPPGHIADVGLNTMYSQGHSVTGRFVNNRSVIDGYCGLVYVPQLGAYGSLVIYGGGHADYAYNEVYRYDVQTRMWSRLTEPCYPIFLNPDTRDVHDTVFGDYWTDATYTNIHRGQICSGHTYATLVWTDPGSFGSDPLGYFCVPSLSVGFMHGGGGVRPHYLPLSTPTKAPSGWGNWFAGDYSIARSVGYGCALYDSARKRVVAYSLNNGASSRNHMTIDCATMRTGLLAGDMAVNTYYATAFHDSEKDIYMVVNQSNMQSAALGPTLMLINPVSGQTRSATIGNGTLMAHLTTGGWEWVQSNSALVYYEGNGSSDVYVIRRPPDPWSGSWNVERKTLTGTPMAKNSAVVPHYTRFRHVKAITDADVFLWTSSNTNPVQAFNVTLS